MSLGTRNALEGMREAGSYIGLGFQFLAAIILFTGGGYWLDTKLGTLPGLTMAGTVVSFAVIIYLVLQVASDAEKRASRKKAPESDAESEVTSSGEGGRSSAKGASGDSSSTLRGGPDFHSGHKRRYSSDD